MGAWEQALADAVAERVALLLSQPRSVELVDAATVATVLSVSRAWVYAHADELGGRRIGHGSRGRLRFDLGRVLDTWRSPERVGSEDKVQRPGRPKGRRPKSTPSPSEDELLPIRRPRGRRRRSARQ